MGRNEEIDRVLEALTATLNDENLDSLDAKRAQDLAGRDGFIVDDGGGVHDASGARVGALRQTSSGEWIAERQNDAAHNADAAIPAAPQPGKLSRMMGELKP